MAEGLFYFYFKRSRITNLKRHVMRIYRNTRKVSVVFFFVLSLCLVGAQSGFTADINLRWAENGEPDLEGYEVHYAPVSDGLGSPAEETVMLKLQGVTGTQPYDAELSDNSNPSYILAGLDDFTIYVVALKAYDNEGLVSDFSAEYRTEKAPQITSGPTVVSVSDTTATIQWTTDEAGTSVVDYGLTTSYSDTESLGGYVTNHSITLTGLISGATYHFMVSSVDAETYGPDANSGDNNPSADTMFVTSGGSDVTPPVITRFPTVTDTTNTTATIYWETNEVSTSLVEYQADTAGPPYSESQSNASYTTTHTMTITGLESATNYHFRVGSNDIPSNGMTYSNDDTFTTDLEPDTTPPVLFGVVVTNITDATAIVEWTTDEPATSTVQYGTSTSYGLSQTVSGNRQNHSVTLTDLNGSTQYHFRASSSDAIPNGPTYSPDITFTTLPTPDTTAPVVTTPPSVIGKTDTTATIRWGTNEPGNSQVRFDIASQPWESLPHVKNDAGLVTTHTVTITGLTVNTTYFYRVGSTDANFNGPDPLYTGDSNPTNTALSFITNPDSTAPVVTTTPTVTGTTDTTATIEWETNEPSNSQVRYDTVERTWTNYGLTRNLAGAVTHHTVTLTGLASDQTYFFRVGSTDIGGNGPDPAFTDDNNPTNNELSFRTMVDETPPTITSPPTVTGITDTSATIEWSTDEPSDNQLQYGENSAGWGSYDLSQNSGIMVTDHVMTITGLTQDTDYYFRVGSTDVENNGPTLSLENTFTTGASADVTPPQFDSPPTVTARTHTSATINWATNEPSNSEIQYGETSTAWGSYDNNESDSAIVTLHSVTITGLTGSTLYYLRAGSTDTTGNGPVISNEFSFTTDASPDTAPPQIVSPPTVTIKTNETATIEWVTDEESNSVVQYGLDSSAWGAYSTTRSNASMVTNHSVTLTNLTGDTVYYFRTGSTDVSGNGPTTSNQVVFITEPDPDFTAPQFTSPPTVTSTTDTSATIAWATDEPGNSQVQYGTVSSTWNNYAFNENDSEMVSSHTVVMTGLASDTLYYVRVGSTDAAENGPSTSSEISFRTDAEVDDIAPRITSPPTVTDKMVSTAIIEWETDEPSNSEVRYGPASTDWNSFGNVENDNDMVTSHSVTITGLDLISGCESGGCRIYYMVGSTDAAENGPDPDAIDTNNPFSEDSFVTEIEIDNTAPRIISGPTVAAVDADSAIIEWETDEPSNSIVKYATETGTWQTYARSEDDAALVTLHSVTITGLSQTGPDPLDPEEQIPVATTYYYSVGSTDAQGNGPDLNQSASNPTAEATLVTTVEVDNTAPQVSNVAVSWVTNSTALITWLTDEPGNSQVRYGLTSAIWNGYDLEENDPDMVMEHSLTITNLQPSTDEEETVYYFMVGSTDAKGNGPEPSSERQFVTNIGPDVSAPQISNFSVQATSGETALVTWTTDEPGNSQVQYDFGIEGTKDWGEYSFSENDAAMTTQHSVTLTRLSPSTLYNVRASSTDASGNNHLKPDDVNPSVERPLETTTSNPPSIVEYPDDNYPKIDASANIFEITYDELNMQNAEAEVNYTLSPALTFASPGNSIDLVSTVGGQSTYRISFSSVEANRIYNLTVEDEITDADGNPVRPNSVLINDNDADDLPDDWEIENGLDPTSSDSAAGQGRNGDFDDDGFINFEEFINNTDPRDEASFPSPPDISQVIPHDQAGLADVFRVPNNSSFAIYISDTGGIDTTNVRSVVFNIDDGFNTEYEIDLGATQLMRIIAMDETDVATAVNQLWVVYDRSVDSYGVFPFDAEVSITTTVTNNNGQISEEEFGFNVETESEHTEATDTDQHPASAALVDGDPAFTDDDHTYNAGFQLVEGDLTGTKLVYNTADVTPELGPMDELPAFNVDNAIEVGEPINLQPPNVFSTPIKLIVPTPGRTDTSGISIYFYNGREWVLGCDASGNSIVEGWMVPGSRVNESGSVQLKIWHFSGIQTAVSDSGSTGGGGDNSGGGDPADDVANCFINMLFF
jgi:Purple acid Phosphatase, N-terminal domain